jgi:hypothetical protein
MLYVLSIWVGLNVWESTQVIRFGILDGVSSKDCKSGRVGVDPFVPTNAPSVVVDEDLIVPHVHYLSFEPLFDCIFYIKPSSNLILSIYKPKLL